MEQYRPESKPHQDKEGSEGASRGIAEAEEEFCKSMMDLIFVILMEGGKVPGGHRVSLAFNVLWLVPTLAVNPVLMTYMDLPPEKECRIVSGETPRLFPSGPSIPSSLSSSVQLPQAQLQGQLSGSVRPSYGLLLMYLQLLTLVSSRSLYPLRCPLLQQDGSLQQPPALLGLRLHFRH